MGFLAWAGRKGQNARAMRGGGTGRLAVTLASTALVVVVALALARVVLAVADPRSSDAASGPQVPGGGVALALYEAVVLIAIALTATVIVVRRPANPVGRLLCAVPLGLGALVLGSHLFWALELDGRDGSLAAWFSSWLWVLAVVPALVLFPLLFPTGAPPGPRWRVVQWLAGFAAVGLLLGQALTPGDFEDYPVDNPFGVSGALEPVAVGLGWTGFACLVVGMLSAFASLVVRFRRARGVERDQLKWVLAAAALFVVIFAFPTEEVAGDDTGFAVLLSGFLVIALAVNVAMLRHRLYDIDVVVNRTLVYGALTMTLAATYAVVVLLLQLVLSPSSDVAVAASTLAAAAVVRPARSRIQEAVDRRFYRRRYDARHTLERFGERVRDEVDLEALGRELRAVVGDAMQPRHVSLWLRTSEDGR